MKKSPAPPRMGRPPALQPAHHKKHGDAGEG